MQSVVILNVIPAKCCNKVHQAGYHYAEYRYVECRYGTCRQTKCCYAECRGISK
jgi:hypothetical protein